MSISTSIRLAAVAVTALFLTASLFAGAACAQDRIEVFGGYSYLRPSIVAEESFTCPVAGGCPGGGAVTPPVFVSSRQNLNGWELAGGVRILSMLRLVGDFGGHYGPTASIGSSNTHQYTYLAGPEFAWPSRVSPFVHILFGGAHQTQSFSFFPMNNAGDNSIVAASHNGFATAFGAGIDLRVIPHLWVRPIQIDYLATHLANATQSQPRVSAGVVLRF